VSAACRTVVKRRLVADSGTAPECAGHGMQGAFAIHNFTYVSEMRKSRTIVWDLFNIIHA
jgi:hypothetical protein